MFKAVFKTVFKTMLSKAITFSQFPCIAAYDDDDGKEEEDVFIGDIVEQYLRRFATMSEADKSFGLQIRMVSFTLGTRKQK